MFGRQQGEDLGKWGRKRENGYHHILSYFSVKFLWDKYLNKENIMCYYHLDNICFLGRILFRPGSPFTCYIVEDGL